jgi:hypothetical protein
MKRKGICSKCGKEILVRDHHYKGYKTDEVKPYCISCDNKAHNNARKEGRCKLTSKESRKASTQSAQRRSYKSFLLEWETLEPNICLQTDCRININTNTLTFSSRFRGHNKTKLKSINE